MALLGDRLIAAVRFTPITVGGANGALLLGPLAVDPDFAGQGFGKRLIAEAIAAAKAAGLKLVVLVGDEAYYGRFGFFQFRRDRSCCPVPSIRTGCSPPSCRRKFFPPTTG